MRTVAGGWGGLDVTALSDKQGQGRAKALGRGPYSQCMPPQEARL